METSKPMKEKIEEMCEVLRQNAESCKTCSWYEEGLCIGNCELAEDNQTVCETLYNAGYRKQEWISVEDRLPDKQGHFLIVEKEGQMNTAFYTPRFGWFSHFRIKNITHWMPLPQPPKMKGGAE